MRVAPEPLNMLWVRWVEWDDVPLSPPRAPRHVDKRGRVARAPWEARLGPTACETATATATAAAFRAAAFISSRVPAAALSSASV